MDDNTTPFARALRRRDRSPVHAVPRALADMPPLRSPVLDADGDVLDPANAGAYVTAWVPPWPGMTLGDSCTLCWLGRDVRGGIARYADARQATVRARVDGMVFAVPVAQLWKLQGGHVSVHYVIHAFALEASTAAYPRSSVARLASPPSRFVVHTRSPKLPGPMDGVVQPYRPP